MKGRRAVPVVFFTSAAIILYEITLSRIFSVLMWYHFVSFAVALALCGMAAGSLLSVHTRHLEDKEASSFAVRYLLFSSLALVSAYLLFLAISGFPSLGYRILSPLHQTYYEPFAAPGGAGGASFMIAIILIVLFLSLPFVGGGAVFAACFERGGSDFRTYCSAMAGSAFGVIIYIAALTSGSGPFAILLSSILFLVPAAYLLGRKGERRGYLIYLLFPALLIAMGNDLATRPADPKFVRGRYVPDIAWSRWDAVSRVAVYPISDEELLKGFGQGSAYGGNPPDGLGMVVDDTGYTGLFGWSPGRENSAFFRHNIASLPYLLKGKGSSLIIGPGGGKDIYCALSSGEFTVDAVEVNALVVRAVQEVFGDFSGRPYSAPKVAAYRREGRSFLEGGEKRYDVIQMTQVFGRVPPQAGAFTLTENHLYTLEAVERMLGSLGDGGILSITRFSFEKTGPRLVNTLKRAMSGRGWTDPQNSFLIAGSKGIMNVMAVKGGVSGDLARKFVKECSEKGFEALYVPGRGGKGMIGRIISGDMVEEEAGYDISPATDDRPFFYYTLLPGEFIRGGATPGKSTEERGAYLVRRFLLLTLSLSLVLPFGAVLFSGRRFSGRRVASLFAFLFAGMGFITVEIILIKKLILPLGFPIYSLSCILLAVFAFSGAGAASCSVLSLGERGVAAASSIILAALLVTYRFGLDPLTMKLVGLSPLPKYAACAVVAGVPAFFMGMPFPALLSVYNRTYRGSKSVPVAVNGFASVTGSMLALAVSMNFGYGASFLLAGGIYVLVALFSRMA